jgi:hypothetical protein
MEVYSCDDGDHKLWHTYHAYEYIFFHFQKLLDDYPKCFIVNADNVGSKQMQQIRAALREQASKYFCLYHLVL